MTKLTLYIGNTCRFSNKVIEHLEQHPMEIEIKDVWTDEASHQELIEITGKSQVPCLKINGSYLHESLDIIEKLKELHILPETT